MFPAPLGLRSRRRAGGLPYGHAMACPYTAFTRESEGITGMSRLRRPFLYDPPRPPARRRKYSGLNTGRAADLEPQVRATNRST